MAVNRLRTIATVIRSLPTTLRFNFAYFPPAQALRFPVVVSHRVWLDRLGGSVDLIGDVRTGGVRIGFGEVGIFDRTRSRTIWHVDGRVVFEGKANLGHGSRLSVDATGTVMFGPGFVITAESTIVCRKAISFGKGVLISWDVLIMDTDYHSIVDETGGVVNADREVIVGDHVWIGCRATILKGTSLADGSIVAAGALVAREFNNPHCIVSGVPAREIRSGVSWRCEPP